MNNAKIIELSNFSLENKRVFIAGHRGMVGSALVRRLQHENCKILLAERDLLDLRRQDNVETWMRAELPQVVFIAAAKVGGIYANSIFPAEFLYENLMIEANIIHTAWKCNVEKLIFLGSTCIYPKFAPQPIREESLLTGSLEPTNEWYAISKIAGVKLCQAYRKQYGCDFIAAQPTNLYGPGDNYNLQTSHVVPALIRKAHEAKISKAKSIIVWGSGRPLREFLHVDDLADATVFLVKNYSDEGQINIGSGEEISIHKLAELVCEVVGYDGKLVFDMSRPDGALRKLCDVTKLNSMGWQTSRNMKRGLANVYSDWLTHGKVTLPNHGI